MVNIRPLNYSRPMVNLGTMRALNGFSEFLSNPIVKSSIANTLAFPSVMFRLSWVRFGVIFRSIQSSIFTPNFNFFVPDRSVTSGGTVISRIYLGRRLVKGFSARFA